MSYPLKIEVGDEAARALRDLSQLDEAAGVEMLNRTTLINRAILVWCAIKTHQHEGGEVILRDADGNAHRMTFE